MENTSDSFMPRPLLFCMKIERSVCYKVTDNKQACERYGIGKTSMRQVAADAGAEIKIGKSYLINFTKVDAYMDSISE